MWRAGEDQSYDLVVKGTVVEALDHLGKPLKLTGQTGRVRLTLGEGPLYLVGPTELTIDSRGKSRGCHAHAGVGMLRNVERTQGNAQ